MPHSVPLLIQTRKGFNLRSTWTMILKPWRYIGSAKHLRTTTCSSLCLFPSSSSSSQLSMDSRFGFIALVFVQPSFMEEVQARKCPGKFNETRYIILTTYTTCVVWLAFVPVFFSTDRINIRVFSLCASLCLNATVTLLCLFAPKLYVALCRPHKNTKEAVMGRAKAGASATSFSNKNTLPDSSDPDSPDAGKPKRGSLSNFVKASFRRDRKGAKHSYAGHPLHCPPTRGFTPPIPNTACWLC